MPERWTDDRIKDFWGEQAREHGVAAGASWSDVRVMDIEVREILECLQDGDRVLDVGCANGHSTLRLATAKRIDVTGVDYIPEMIDGARRALRGCGNLRGTVKFEVGDARALAFPDASFDKVVVVRVIINLGAWENQRGGLAETARVLKPGGVLALSEATVQGWRRLNALREEWALPPIPMPEFNNYLDETQVVEALAPTCDLLEISNFASSYYVGSRVFKPLLARVAGCEGRVADPLCELNRWLSMLPAAGDYGTQKLFIFRKRSARG
jgi:ubiquinone/menaquinone biosynthesis C-methylase UbiE